MKLLVRCCCQPRKILGTVEVPDAPIAPGQVFTFIDRASLPTIERGMASLLSNPDGPTLTIRHIRLPVEIADDGRGLQHFTLKAEGMTVEQLRAIGERFEEARPGQCFDAVIASSSRINLGWSYAIR